jgi:sialate O-acetylesterase
MKQLILLVISILLLPAASVCAELRLSNAFTDHMVLQQQMPIRVWGWATPGGEIQVKLAGKKTETTAGEDGKWLAELPAMQADNKPYKLQVSSGSEKVELQDVLLGEVWICSGQSNMFMPIRRAANAEQETAAAEHSAIRLFNMPEKVQLDQPQEDAQPGAWTACSPKTVSGFSAVGYFFGRELNQELGVPVGLIGTSWGATRIEPWTPASGFQQVKELRELNQAIAKGELMTGTRDRPTDRATTIYNGMVAGLTPMTVRGVIWYQGESNAGDGLEYNYLKEALVKGWRTEFQNEYMSFYWVQIAPFKRGHTGKPEGGGNGPVMEGQRRAMRLPHTGMVVTNDIGDPENIHPKNKQDVGKRLALWALAKNYDKDIAYSGPTYQSFEVQGDKALINFEHADSGLMVGTKEGPFHMGPVEQIEDGELKGFSIRDAKGDWHWAKARIDGQRVVVWSEAVSRPTAVRYAYDSLNDGNLYNKDRLPASPFTTID